MKAKPPRQPGTWIPDVFVRRAMPASADRVFDLLTRGDQMQLWLCDEATSDVREGGRVLATWRDPMHPEETVTRRGTWFELERPTLAYLRWDDPSPDARPGHDEVLKFAIAAEGDGAIVTVQSPCPQQFERTTVTTVQDATRQSWTQLLDELGGMLREEQSGDAAG